MQTSRAQAENEFSGGFDSGGGPQFLGNHFNAPVHFDLNGDNRPPPTSVCDLPSFLLSPYFTGRDDELQEIEKQLNTTPGKQPRCCVIHGMPGVGKTQLALKYATLAFQRGRHPYVLWMSAVSVEKVTLDFSKLADLVRLPGRHRLDQSGKLTAMRAWLEDSTAARSWLLILDNVSEETVFTVRDVLPRGDCSGSLLMTTRTASVANALTASEASAQLALSPPGTDEAVAMLSAGAKLQRKEGGKDARLEDAKNLVRSVGHLPLAIDQAASYMRETGSSPEKILEVYHSDEVPEMLSWENDLSRHEEKSVVATFLPALDRIQQTAPDAVTLLRLLCFCNPESISISILEHGCSVLHQGDQERSSHKDEVDQPRAREKQSHPVQRMASHELESAVGLFRAHVRLSKALQVVQRLSLAAQMLEGDDRVIRIHDLVHLLLRTKIMTDQERQQWLKVAICIVCTAFDEIEDCQSPQNWSQCSRFISHFESLEKCAMQYGLHHVGLLDASMSASVYLYACGLYEQAAIWNKRMLEQQKRLLGEEHPDTLTSMNNLAIVLKRQGKYEEAEGMHRQALALREIVLGKKHPYTLTSMNNLANVLESQGKDEEAEGMHRRALALREIVLGKKHPDTLTSMNNLASVLEGQGKYEEAEGMHRRALALKETVLGKKHPHTLSSMNNLAFTWKKQGRDQEAASLMQECVQLQREVLGSTHPNTEASVKFMLAWEG